MQTYLKLNNEADEGFMDFVKQLFQHASSYGSRSSILSPWIWLIGTLLGAITLSVLFKASIWVLVFLSVLISIAFLSAVVSYFHCLFNGNTDALRSEKFNIEKLVIEKQISGDSLTGTELRLPNRAVSRIGHSGAEDDQA